MSETRKRPTRACTARTPSRLAPLAPAVERPPPQLKKQDDQPAPLIFSNPLSLVPEQKDLHELRRMWELASIINFFNTFRPILKLVEFSAEELETALLTCNDLLMDIHTALLKGIHPPSRVPLNRDSWVTVLYKKLKDRWSKVAEPPFPLAESHGSEAETYSGFDPSTRLIILRALCEVRLDQDDVRAHMEEPVKKGYLSLFRKERAGSNLLGTTYWCENNPISGYRLYRDIPTPKGKEFKGRTASPPPPGQWETLASNFDEFQSVADTLLSSKFKQEIGLGKRLKQDILPVLEAVEKKKVRDLKRKQRQAKLLVTTLEHNLDSGRAKRDRKPVNYTFPEYDRSINEAIKSTRKPERAAELANGHSTVANGHGSHPEKRVRKERVNDGDQTGLSPCDLSNNHAPFDPREDDNYRELSDGPATSNDSAASDDAGTSFRRKIKPRSRQRRRSQRYCGKDYVDAAYTEEDDLYSDDEIEGEAIYDDDFVRRRERKRKRGDTSSVEDEEYRGDDHEDVDDDDDDVAVSYSEEEEELEQQEEKQEFLVRSMRRARRPKRVADTGLRRSKRATRSKVNYNAYEHSEEEEEDEEDEEEEQAYTAKKAAGGNGELKASPSSIDDADYSMESAGSLHSSGGTSDTGNQVIGDEETGQEQAEMEEDGEQDDTKEEDKEEGADGEDEEENTQGGWSHVNGDGEEDEDERGKQLRFFDLNECAPADSPRDWMKGGFLDGSQEAEIG
ncbi:DDT domain-containing protein DDR4 [Selaginella moellendorffii]|uniref:DDT domain-containing protein DDR4 n=1 Tax=Selaginella moellendorffii TaxID=88036 RepID=UPI000D1C7D5D|nr:DDT domain-containing protein DDR4 [Selaginella moellendorffii]|eukprot:XP_024539253.1 DDT domain-containing protein DDR4 [Selaginella moellendorffii]